MKNTIFFLLVLFSLKGFGQKTQIVQGAAAASATALKTATTTTLQAVTRSGKLTAIVTDVIGGGTFNYSSESLSDDNGIIFPASGGGHWVRDVSQSDLYRPEWFGAVRDGVTDDGAAIQAAINAGIAAHTGVQLSGGTYYTTTGFVFNSSSVVSNAAPFGFVFQGIGMLTEIKSNMSAGVLFDFNGSGELQVNFRNIFAYDITGTTTGLRINHLSRYSTFENFRQYGFLVGHRYVGECYAVTFNNCTIRGSMREAILVDDVTMVGHALTEFHYSNCYFDNNGRVSFGGGSYVPVINLFNSQEFSFNSCVFEGNFGGGITIRGASQNVHFRSGRMEETLIRFGTGGHIHSIASTVRTVTFTGVQIAYDKNGVDGTKDYQCIFAGGQQTIFENCHFLETSDVHATDFFGATSLSNDVQIINPMNGNSGFYVSTFPNEFLVSHINTSLLLNKRLLKFNSTNPKVLQPSVIADSTTSVFIGANATIHGGGGGVMLTIDDTTTFGGSISFRNLSNIPGWYLGLAGNTTGSFFLYNNTKNTIPLLIDTLDHVTFLSTVSGVNGVASTDFITKAQHDAIIGSLTTNFLPKKSALSTALVNSVFSDNGTDGTVTAGFLVPGALSIGQNVSGAGGAVRFINDAGTFKWRVGLLGSAAAADYVVYDLVNSAARLTVNGTTGAASFGSTVSGSRATSSAHFVILSQLNTDSITVGTNKFSQWTTSGSNVYYPTTSGNVGIGRVPTAKFDVKDSSTSDLYQVLIDNTHASGGSGMKINRTNTARASQIQYSTSGTGDWWQGMLRNSGNATTNFYFGTGSDVGTTTPVLTLQTNGRVGIGTIAPTSTFQNTGSFARAYISKATSYTATISDDVIEVTATGQTITLPTAVGCTGRIYTIKLTASGSSTINTTSSQTIDGSTTYSLSAQYKYVEVQSNNANWNIIANN